MSLVAGWFPTTVAVVAVLSLLALVPWEKRARWRVVGVGLLVAALVTVAAQLLLSVSGALPYTLPWSFDLWFALVVLVPVLAVLAWRHVRWRRALTPLALAVCLAAAVTAVNQQYDYVPTTQALLDPPADTASLHQVESLRGQTTQPHHHRVVVAHGAVLQLPIPGTVSHFDARPAYIWLPPAYLDNPHEQLPVLELLGGTPGSPVDWIRGGDAVSTADAFAARHHGIAPLLVMPDVNGSLTGDTECVDGAAGNAATYLTVDVPAFMRTTFQAVTGPDSLALAGLSEGGTCALDLALTHPGVVRAFADFSGLAAPTVAADVDAPLTTRVLFHGSTAAYAAHDPAHLLRTHHYPGLAGWFEVGTQDPACLRAQTTLAPLAIRAGVEVQAVTVPGGGHDYTLWAASLDDSLPYLAAQLDLTPPTTVHPGPTAPTATKTPTAHPGGPSRPATPSPRRTVTATPSTKPSPSPAPSASATSSAPAA